MEMNSKEHRALREIQFSVVSYRVYTRAHTCSAEYLYTIFGSSLKNSNIIVHLAPSLLLGSHPILAFPVAALRDHPVSVTLLTSPALPLLPKSIFPLHPCGHPPSPLLRSELHMTLSFLCPIPSRMELLDTT